MLFKRIFSFILLFGLSNLWILTKILHTPAPVNVAIFIVLAVFFLCFNVNPEGQKKWTARIEALMGGRALFSYAFILLFIDVIFYIYLLAFSKLVVYPYDMIINGVVCLALLLVLVWNGIIRMICLSKQLSLISKLALIFAWWVPIANIILIWHCCHVIRREYLFDVTKSELNDNRKENEICKTKYPILLVHGIFWRDWQLFNYWGRIPKELIRNGATIFYGNQQSAAPMDVVAGELKKQILQILEQEKCEKVNIIAHSKGGLDARYTISCLDMDNHVGSLTTIGTPHSGSMLVDGIVKRLLDSFLHVIAKKYNVVYKKLGDKEPDFYSGIHDLTTEQCAVFNKMALNKENVLYQSIASQMDSFFSAGFPLNIGYAALSHIEGNNDGFVSIESSKWGDYLGCFSTKYRRGVSHGDMIDLTRENIRGFDVCEFYVDVVKGLKARGL